MDSKTLPGEYLELCSLDALESLELARLNNAANLRGELKEVLQRWIEAEVDAKLARWMLEKRRSQAFRAGAAKLAPAKVSLGNASRALLAPAAAMAGEHHSPIAVRPSASRPALPAAQIASPQLNRNAPAFPSTAEPLHQPAHTRAPSRPRVTAALPRAESQLSLTLLRTESILSDERTGSPPNRKLPSGPHCAYLAPDSDELGIVDLLPNETAVAAARALPASARVQRRKPEPMDRRTKESSPQPGPTPRRRDRLLRSSNAALRRAGPTKLAAGNRRLAPAS
ncbi:MAG: hypothetical protein ACRD4R_01000 [Candidatus Acidiferrales bacterium]